MTHGELDDLYTTRELRDLCGYSADFIAKQIGISAQHYRKVEAGTRNFTLTTANKWLNLILSRLDDVYTEGTDVEWHRVPGFHDIATQNEGTH